jgi:hypothetical protein
MALNSHGTIYWKLWIKLYTVHVSKPPFKITRNISQHLRGQFKHPNVYKWTLCILNVFIQSPEHVTQRVQTHKKYLLHSEALVSHNHKKCMPIRQVTELCKNANLLKVNCSIFGRPFQSQTKYIQTLDATVRIRTILMEIAFHFQRQIQRISYIQDILT